MDPFSGSVFSLRIELLTQRQHKRTTTTSNSDNHHIVAMIRTQLQLVVFLQSMTLRLQHVQRVIQCSTVYAPPIRWAGMLTAVTHVPPRSTLRDALNGNYVVPRTRLKFGERTFSVAAPPLPEHGTGCQQNSSWCLPRQSSSVPWKRSCSRLLTALLRAIAILNWTS